MFSRSKESKKEDDGKLLKDRKWLPADTAAWTPAEPRKGHPWTTAASSTKGSKAGAKAVALRPGMKASSGPAVLERASRPASFRSVGRSIGPSSLRSQPSAMSVITYHSEITKDPIGGPRHWFKLPNPKAYKDLVKNFDAVYEQPHVLMLGAGQGGTFGYGTKYTHERDREVSGPCLVVNSSNTKHLTFFGRGIDFIGTKDCILHWHLLPGTLEYIDIRTAIYDRLEVHSREYGWTSDEVQLATLTVICPEPERQAFVVPDALKDFLHLNARPEVLNGHGFIMKPGDRTDKAQSEGTVLYNEYQMWDGRAVTVYHDVPDEFTVVDYEHRSGKAIDQHWCYTYNRKWHNIKTSEHGRFGKLFPLSETTTVQKFDSYGSAEKY